MDCNPYPELSRREIEKEKDRVDNVLDLEEKNTVCNVFKKEKKDIVYRRKMHSTQPTNLPLH